MAFIDFHVTHGSEVNRCLAPLLGPPKLPRGMMLTYGPPEVFTLADVRELQDFLPLLAFPFAFSTASCRDGRGKMSGDGGLVQGSRACVLSQ